MHYKKTKLYLHVHQECFKIAFAVTVDILTVGILYYLVAGRNLNNNLYYSGNLIVIRTTNIFCVRERVRKRERERGRAGLNC